MDGNSWLLVIVAGAPGAIIAGDRILTALSNLGLWPSRMRRYDRARAERIVAELEREESLDLLAANTKAILAHLEPNGGKSMRDAVNRLQEGNDTTQRLLQQHIDYARATDEHTTERLARIDERLESGDRQFGEIRDLLRERNAS